MPDTRLGVGAARIADRLVARHRGDLVLAELAPGIDYTTQTDEGTQ